MAEAWSDKATHAATRNQYTLFNRAWTFKHGDRAERSANRHLFIVEHGGCLLHGQLYGVDVCLHLLTPDSYTRLDFMFEFFWWLQRITTNWWFHQIVWRLTAPTLTWADQYITVAQYFNTYTVNLGHKRHIATKRFYSLHPMSFITKKMQWFPLLGPEEKCHSHTIVRISEVYCRWIEAGNRAVAYERRFLFFTTRTRTFVLQIRLSLISMVYCICDRIGKKSNEKIVGIQKYLNNWTAAHPDSVEEKCLVNERHFGNFANGGFYFGSDDVIDRFDQESEPIDGHVNLVQVCVWSTRKNDDRNRRNSG